MDKQNRIDKLVDAINELSTEMNCDPPSHQQIVGFIEWMLQEYWVKVRTKHLAENWFRKFLMDEAAMEIARNDKIDFDQIELVKIWSPQLVQSFDLALYGRKAVGTGWDLAR